MNKTVFVEATFEIVGAIKGHRLADRRTILVPVELNTPGVTQPYSLEAFKKEFFLLVDNAISAEGTKAFIQRLKTETELKRKVGGTKWKVECSGGIEAQPIYIKEAKLGDFYQFLRGKRVARWDEEKDEQYFTMIYTNLVGQIQERNYAILKQLYEAAVKAPAANDGDEKQVA